MFQLSSPLWCENNIKNHSVIITVLQQLAFIEMFTPHFCTTTGLLYSKLSRFVFLKLLCKHLIQFSPFCCSPIGNAKEPELYQQHEPDAQLHLYTAQRARFGPGQQQHERGVGGKAAPAQTAAPQGGAREC